MAATAPHRPRARLRTWRRLWGQAHLLFGLMFGGWFVLLGLTGSVLVFQLETDVCLRPWHRVTPPTTMPEPQAVLMRLRALHPERDGPWRIEWPLASDQPLRARYLRPVERADRVFAPLLVTLDPGSLTPLSQGFWGDDPVTWLYDLHYALLLDRPGRVAVGVAGLALLVSMLSGLALWWPAKGRRLAALAPRLRPGAVRRVYDLHLLAGVQGGALLAVIVSTGVALAFPDQTRGLLGLAQPPLVAPVALAQQRALAPLLPLDAAVGLALEAFGGGEVRWIESSDSDGRAPVSVRVHLPGDPGRRFPHARVSLDPRSGALLHLHDPRAGAWADTVLAWLHPLHNGEAFGMVGRLLAACAGLLPLLLFVSGLLRWRHKRAARRAAPKTDVSH